MIPALGMKTYAAPGVLNPAIPLTFVAAIIATSSLTWWLSPLFRPGGAPPPGVMAIFEKAGDGKALPVVRTIDTRAEGTPNAYAFRNQGRDRIVISEELVEVLTPAEAAAMLLHELGHLRLGHVRQRTWILWTGWIVAGLVGFLYPEIAVLLMTLAVASLHGV